MRSFILSILLCLGTFTNFAQLAANYGFLATNGTYSSISGTTGVTSVALNCDDCNVGSIPIGFTFRFCGTNYTTLAASSNGFLSLANNVAAPATNLAANITGHGFLMPYWDDLYGGTATPAPATFYITTGTAPNRIFTFEWKDFHKTATGAIYGNFQVKLYESTNNIEFVYGNGTFTAASGVAATIGIANTTTDWQTLSDNTFAPLTSSTTFTDTITTLPATGQIYRWIAPCSGTPVAGTVTPSLAAGCVPYTSLLTLTGGVSPTVPGISYIWKSSLTGTSWTLIPGATNSTYLASVSSSIYYHIITVCSYSSATAVTPPVLLSINATGPITGIDSLCVEGATTLADTTIGGIWSSGNTSVATVNSSGAVGGVAVGSTTITYSHSGCDAVVTVYVLALPDAGTITGLYDICQTPVSFSETVPSGIWGITNTSIAGVSTVGAVFAILPGLDTITYSVANYCGTAVATYPINTTPCLSEVGSLASQPTEGLSVYPNPSTGTFNVLLSAVNEETVTLTLTNIQGTPVLQTTISTNKSTPLSRQLPAGIYILSATTPSGQKCQKMIVTGE